MDGKREAVLFTDEKRNAVWAPDLADALVELAVASDYDGLLHVGGPDATTRYDIAVVRRLSPLDADDSGSHRLGRRGECAADGTGAAQAVRSHPTRAVRRERDETTARLLDADRSGAVRAAADPVAFDRRGTAGHVIYPMILASLVHIHT